ncbi:hypothetical protein NKH77_30090 [Streptomyces sp. M19]
MVLPDDVPRDEIYFGVFRQHAADHQRFPSMYQFSRQLRQGTA